MMRSKPRGARTMWGQGEAGGWRWLRTGATCVAVLLGVSGVAYGAAIERISVGAQGQQADNRSEVPAVNADGSVVAFKSQATNLIPGTPNTHISVFVRDRIDGSISQVSIGWNGQPDANSYPPALDHAGGVVAFGSDASNILIGDFNQVPDMFVRERASGTVQSPTLINDGYGGGRVPDLRGALSADASLVAFTSSADALVPDIDRNEANDVFVAMRATGARELISVATVGGQPGRSANAASAGPALSENGCIVAVYSDASNLVSGDTNGVRDVFVRNRCADPATTDRVSVATGGAQANGPSQPSGQPPAISGDGRYVVFASDASNLVADDTNGVRDVFIRDRVDGTTTRVTPPEGCTDGGGAALEASGASDQPSVSGDGRYVAFVSLADNLVSDDTNRAADVFVLDRESRLVARVLGTGNVQPNASSSFPQLTFDGQKVALQSDATNLVPDDTNGKADVFLSENPFVADEPPPGVTPLPTCTPIGGPPTATPTPRATSSATAVPTVTATRPPTATLTATLTATAVVPTATPTVVLPTATITRAPTPTNTAAATPTATVKKGGGGGDGCSCRIDGDEAVPPPWHLLAVMLPPAVLLVRRRAQRARPR